MKKAEALIKLKNIIEEKQDPTWGIRCPLCCDYNERVSVTSNGGCERDVIKLKIQMKYLILLLGNILEEGIEEEIIFIKN